MTKCDKKCDLPESDKKIFAYPRIIKLFDDMKAEHERKCGCQNDDPITRDRKHKEYADYLDNHASDIIQCTSCKGCTCIAEEDINYINRPCSCGGIKKFVPYNSK